VCYEKTVAPGFTPHTSHTTPRKPPSNFQPARHRTPAPAARNICRTPTQIKIFSPVGPASSGKRAIRYGSSTGLAFVVGCAFDHHPAPRTLGICRLGACGGKTIASFVMPQPPHASHFMPHASHLPKRPQIPNPRGIELQRQRRGIVVEHPPIIKSLAP